MGIAIPITLFFLLELSSIAQLLTIAAVTFVSWGLSDLLSMILERPRLKHRSPAQAIRQDWERRANE